MPLSDAERWVYLEEVRQGAIRVAIHARALQEFPRPRTATAAALEDEMARRFAAEVVHLRDDAAIMPTKHVALWRRTLRRLAVALWRLAW
jgi:hypothetical protein